MIGDARSIEQLPGLNLSVRGEPDRTGCSATYRSGSSPSTCSMTTLPAFIVVIESAAVEAPAAPA
jgi:hypothetical protein